MDGDINPLADAYRIIHYLFMSDWLALEPLIKRILTLFFYVVGMIFIWKWVTKK
jgi:hypothetical protein